MAYLSKNRDFGWTPFAWLIYLAPLLIPLFANPRPGEIALAAAVVLVFLALYFRVYLVRGRAQLYATVGIVLLALAYTPFNPGATTLFVYAAAFLGLFFTRKKLVIGVVLMLLALAVEVVLFDLPIYSWAVAAVFCPFIGALNFYYSDRGRADAKLRLAQSEVKQLAKFDERERIARDLHDVLGHTLSVVTLKAELVGRLLPNLRTRLENGTGKVAEVEQQLEQLKVEINDIETLSRRAMNEVRSSVRGYQNHRLEIELAKARMALAAAQIHLLVDAEPLNDTWGDLDPEKETVLAHALREAVTNVVRHSRAMQCVVKLESEAEHFVLEVTDDGIGVRSTPGSGLNGMRERVQQMGGSVSVKPLLSRSLLGTGTSLTVRLPTGNTALAPMEAPNPPSPTDRQESPS